MLMEIDDVAIRTDLWDRVKAEDPEAMQQVRDEIVGLELYMHVLSLPDPAKYTVVKLRELCDRDLIRYVRIQEWHKATLSESEVMMNTVDVLNTLDPHARLPTRSEDCTPWDDLKHRRGRFKINSDLIKDSPETAMRVFGRMVLVRAEHSFMNNIIEYDAYSPLFRALDEGERAPFYNFEVDDEGPVKAIESGMR